MMREIKLLVRDVNGSWYLYINCDGHCTWYVLGSLRGACFCLRCRWLFASKWWNRSGCCVALGFSCSALHTGRQCAYTCLKQYSQLFLYIKFKMNWCLSWHRYQNLMSNCRVCWVHRASVYYASDWLIGHMYPFRECRTTELEFARLPLTAHVARKLGQVPAFHWQTKWSSLGKLV